MAIFRAFNDIVISLIESLRLSQPELDTKPGTVARDVFVDAPAQQFANLYGELRNISNLQSFFSSSGTDLNKLAANFGVSRIQGGTATGVAVFTTNNLDVDILIPPNTVITANNGLTFRTVNNAVMTSANSNVFRANATRLRSDLDLASITDEFAIEVTVEAQTPGTAGNIGRFSLISQNVAGVSNVTNLQTFSGGSDPESDDDFRTRILGIFAGSNTGTQLGYSNAVELVPGVEDSLVVVPGDPLLIRDGTQVATDLEGNLIVSEAGTGGKVDIYILGTVLASQIDTFIYNDQSGKDDPTDPSNEVILGQQGEDPTINAAQRRVELIDDLPLQPVESIISVAGSSSGSNFVEAFVDDQGRTRGNFELLKDSGDFGGSPFGFDKIRWISDQIELEDEERTKGIFNGSDELNFTDVRKIQGVNQNFLVTNENPTVNVANRSEITLRHAPVISVSRLINVTTGERYIVENPNPDGEVGEPNLTGRIIISGSTLPVGTDVLQADYIWEKPFDNTYDFDNLEVRNPFRSVQDSVDWSYSNLVTREPAIVQDDGYGVLTVTVTHPIFKVISVDTFDSDVSTISNGTLTVNEDVLNVIDIKRDADGVEVFNTDASTGTLTGTNAIILPADTLAEDGDIVTTRFNAFDIFAPDGYDPGTFESNIITVPEGVSANGTKVLVTYVANIATLLPETELTDLPVVLSGNQLATSDSVLGAQPISNLTDSNNEITNNLRRAGTHLRVIADSTPSPGTITITGTTRRKVVDALVVSTVGSGFEIDLQSAIKEDLGTSTIPSSVKITKLISFERVEVDQEGNVSEVDNVYDIVNYKLQDNSFDLGVALADPSLNSTKVELPLTPDNEAARLDTGDIVRVTFYYIDTNSSELLFFSKNGAQVTDKIFTNINRISLGSGFKNPAGEIQGNITVLNFNQPISNTAYLVDYDYVAPKENERITVTFNHNVLVNQVTQSIEDVRPITADVLIKAAKAKDVDVRVRIVLLPDFIEQEQTVLQDAVDAVSSFLNTNTLGSTVDASDIINVLYTVEGIDRVTIITFSTEDSGNLLSITALNNEFLRAGNVNIIVEER